MTIVLLLLLVWAIALAPMVWRKLIDVQVISEVARFNHRIGILRRATPVHAAGPLGALQLAPPAVPRPRVLPEAQRLSPEKRRAQRARAQIRVARRRRTLQWLGGTVGVTFVFGAIPPLRFLWDLTLVATLLTVAYVGLLAWCQRPQTLASDRGRRIVAIGAARDDDGMTRGSGVFTAPGGPSGAMRASTMRRPAFVLVEGPS